MATFWRPSFESLMISKYLGLKLVPGTGVIEQNQPNRNSSIYTPQSIAKLLNSGRELNSHSFGLLRFSLVYFGQYKAQAVATNMATRIQSKLLSAKAENLLSNLTSFSSQKTKIFSARSGGIMARHKNGWVKLWRKAALGDINSNFTRGGLFGAVVCMANIQNSTVSWKGKPRKLERGEVVTSLQELAELGEVDPRTVARHLNYLALRETISVEKCSTGTLIKINNYERYQGVDAEDSEPSPDDMQNGMHNGLRATGIHNEELKNKRIKETSRTVPEKSGPVQIETVEDLLGLFSEKVKAEWLILYPDPDFVQREAIKALHYYDNNPGKKPKVERGWKKAFSSWLGRGWSYHAKNLKGQKPAAKANLDDIAWDPS